MTQTLTTLPLILLCVFLNTGAQILLKLGVRGVGEMCFALQGLPNLAWRLCMNPAIIGGLGLYVMSVALWLFVLSKVEVSVAYPLSSLGYVLTALCGSWILGEMITPVRWVGIGVILVGVYLVSRS
ncbi:MAG: 4-amino-4-deoxy-L-arabinose transferase [Candidatus Puniceispirillum sp.]|nr:4-amino-4-deoxy-L-arabinose transferase [Candidatus Puniceispirillum sp.]